MEVHGSAWNSAFSETTWLLSDVSSNVSSFTLGPSAAGSGELDSRPESWISGVVMVTSQLDTALSLSESVSLSVVPYLNASSTDFPTGKHFAGSLAGFAGDFTLGVLEGGLTVPLKKDCSVFCAGPKLAALPTLDLFPELELWWLEKAAFRPARFRDDFGLWVTGSFPGSPVFSLDGTSWQISDAFVSRDKWQAK